MTKDTPKIVARKSRHEPMGIHLISFDQGQIEELELPPAIAKQRQNARQIFEHLPVPTTDEEAWRRTSLQGIDSIPFEFPKMDAYLSLAPLPGDITQPVADQDHVGEVRLMPGAAVATLTESLKERGVIFTDLITAEKKYPELIEKIIGSVVKPSEGKFAAFAAAFAQTGVFLYVPQNVTIEQPLHSLMWGPGSHLAHVSHIIVWLEEGASATYVHEYASPTEAEQALHAGIVEIKVGANANLRFVELQSWGEHMWNFTHERASIERAGKIDWVFGAIGGNVTKNFSDLELIGSGSQGRMSGFYFTDGHQHLDYDSQQNHLNTNTTSDLLFKGALIDQSRVVWQGMIYVAPGATKTDGYQANRNLLLSKAARADSIPGLEILADDVRCTHGATVGKIDPNEVFYLQSRGIPKIETERLIVEGFFDPIMQRIPFEGVRARFQMMISQKMKAYQG